MAQPEKAIQAWLVSRISEEMGIAPDDIDVREPFASYGLTSVEAVGLTGDLEIWLDRPLSPTLAYEYPTVKALAHYLAEEADVAPEAITPSIETTQGTETMPIAIIGIACRFPGAKDTDEYWHLLQNGLDAITEVPEDRWDLRSFYDPDVTIPGKMNTRWGGFLESVDQFDPLFFGISPREATRMDPQQRLLLELVWEAFEDAGQIPEHLAATRTGVFVGISTNEYSQLQLSNPDLIDAYAGTGNAFSIAANRLSYTFDLQGPSVAIDTACSSSLVAVHLACESIRHGESSLAVAGGVNLILSSAITISFSKAGAMAPDGRCKAFDASANGYVRSEGAGVVLLKPLERALADGDPIYAVIRGSAINQDGRTNGLMAPSGQGQVAVLQEAYRKAQISPGEVQYVETHGTGTLLGDPIEAKALGAVLSTDREPGNLCAIGSVKTNIGHLESAAGVAGLIKIALSLKHRVIPPSLHFQEPNPHIPFDELPLRVQTEKTSWPESSGPALAGVSSFGFGGTNAHIVLEEAPHVPETGQPPDDSTSPKAHLLPISARSPAALQSLAQGYHEALGDSESNSEATLRDICYTASVRRSHHGYRKAFVGSSHQELHSHLEALLQDESISDAASNHVDHSHDRRLVFVFSGQGSQWLGMARELFEQEVVFRETLERCRHAIMRHAGWDLREELFASEEISRLDEIDVVQPTLFGIQVALAALWRSWGIEPDAVVGHSMGEVAAAHVAGGISLEDAARVICHRSLLMKRVSGQGGMIATQLSLEEAQRTITGYEDRVSVAVSNGPTSTVLSGDPTALEEIREALVSQDIFAREVEVDVAAHSPQMESLLTKLTQALEGIRPQPVSTPLYSTVTGDLIDGLELDASYWARNLREQVLFWPAVKQLTESGHDTFLEISPHPVLLTAIQQGLQYHEKEGAVVASGRRDEEQRSVMLQALGQLYTLGFSIDWDALYPTPGRTIRLPSYPWTRERYWLEIQQENGNRASGWPAAVGASSSLNGHPLLVHHLSSAVNADTHFWEMDLGIGSFPYLDDHRVQGEAILPATVYLETVLTATEEIFGTGPHTLENVSFKKTLALREDHNTRVQLVISPETPEAATFQFFSLQSSNAQEQASWTLHATGKVRPGPNDLSTAQAKHASPDDIRSRLSNVKSGTEYYRAWEEHGLQYGPSFQGIERVWRQDGEAVGQLRFSRTAEAESSMYHIHPTFLDACFQVLGAALPSKDSQAANGESHLLAALGTLRVHERPLPGTNLWSHVLLRPPTEGDEKASEGDVFVIDDNGNVVLEATGLRIQHLDAATRHAMSEQITDWLYEIQWEPTTLPQGERAPAALPSEHESTWLIFTDSSGVGATLKSLLETDGQAIVTVSPGTEYANTQPGYYELNPNNPEDFQRLLTDVLEAAQAPVRGVIHLWATETTPLHETTLESLEASQISGPGSVLHIVQALGQAGWDNAPRLWLVTRGAQPIEAGSEPLSLPQSPLWGMRNTIAHEHPELRCTIVDLSSASPEDEVQALFQELQFEGLDSDGQIESQIALRGDARYAARLVEHVPDYTESPPDEQTPSDKIATSFGERGFRLETDSPGLLDTLVLRETPRKEPGPGEVEIQVYATGLNFLDVLSALGMRPDLPDGPIQLGIECAGRITALGSGVEKMAIGDEVIAIAPSSFGAFVTTAASLVVPKPANLSFEEAATIPIAFLTAYIALHDFGRLREGERVLIHSAAGGVGLAAVQLAQRAEAEIFATAGNPDKRDFLRSLGIEHVMDSRSTAFAEEVMDLTGGEGMDAVLNSLAGEAIPKGLSTLRPNGRFLEIGKRDIYENSQLELGYLRNNVSFFAIDLVPMLTERPDFCGDMLRDLVALFEDGTLAPPPYQVFSITEVESAFRYMANAKHTGKIVVSLQEQEVLVERPGETAARFRPDGTYLVTGGLGGLGLKVAEWMVEQGGRHLVLMGRSGPSTEAEKALKAMEQAGAQVVVAKADVTSKEQVTKALAEIGQSMPPLRGVIHAAGILDDGILLQLNQERLQSVMAPKISGAWNLHALTIDEPLDFFVLFSSAASVLGSPGQANYSAANAFLDALAHYRKAQGKPALSINWGPWADVGLAARPDRGGRLEVQGFKSITPDKGMEALGTLLLQASPQIAVMPIDWQRLHPEFTKLPLLSQLTGEKSAGKALTGMPGVQQSEIRQAILEAEPEERPQLLETHFRERVSRVLGLSSFRLDPRQPLNTIGIDSLMAVELKNQIEVDLGIAVPMAEFLQGPSIAELVTYVLRQLETATVKPAVLPSLAETRALGKPEDAKQLLANIDQLTDEEVDALLAEMLDSGEQ